MTKLLALGNISDGKLIISNRRQFDADLKQWEGKRVELTIQKAKKSRSLQQNAFYYAVVLPVALKGFIDAGNLGITKDDVHEFMKSRFLKEGKEIIIPKSGQTFTVSKTTTTLSTTEFMDYIEQIAQFCSEWLGVVIPEPTPLFAQ